ncbi:hypothetical protein BD311DRAFT_750295 [Dichomitus squalens]|uniref:Uncharacterized protein n=1 Tax=Dichomitus squalens TaxID=114155 RepID=A0A4Q9N0E5_9APHY|nr:hypothetical protein BD311DRAFT_750295 [Dichomitus squalens]
MRRRNAHHLRFRVGHSNHSDPSQYVSCGPAQPPLAIAVQSKPDSPPAAVAREPGLH